MQDNDTGGTLESSGEGAVTAASTEARNGKRSKRPVDAETVRNRFLTDEELEAKAKDFGQLQRDYVARAGVLLDEVKKHTNKGKWGEFCKKVGITRRKADQYIFVARSPIAERLEDLGIAKALLLARYPDKAKLQLRNKSVATMSVKELEAKLRGTPQKKTGVLISPAKPEGYREVFGDGQNTDALIAWAAGALFVRPEEFATRTFIKTAREHYAALRQLLGGDYHATLDDAIKTLEEGTSRTAAAA